MNSKRDPLLLVELNIAAKSNVYIVQWNRVSEIFDPRWFELDSSCTAEMSRFNLFGGTH